VADRILILGEQDGCAPTAGALADQLAQSGFAVERVADTRAAAERLLAGPSALVVRSDSVRQATEACAALRWAAGLSIFAIVPQNAGPVGGAASVTGLFDAGADCVLTPDVDRRELAARLRASFRLAGPPQVAEQSFAQPVAGLEVDERRHRVTVGGRQLSLTPTEFRLLVALARRSGRIARHEELIREVWGKDIPDGAKDLRLYVSYLRQKLDEVEDPAIALVNQRGVGYRLAEAVAS